MKIIKLDRRYKANAKFGYNYSITFNKQIQYYAFKKQARDMFGFGWETDRRFMWKSDIEGLCTGAWAFHSTLSSKHKIVYFRAEQDMTRCIMMHALTIDS